MVNKKTDLVNMSLGSFLASSFRTALASFWAALGVNILIAFIIFLTIVAIYLLARMNPLITAGIMAFLYVIIIAARFLAFYPITESRIIKKEMGVFAAVNIAGSRAVYFILGALIMSVPVSLVSLALHFAGVTSYIPVIIANIINLFFLLFLSFMAPAVVLREKGPIDCLKYSFYLVKGSYFKTLGYMLFTILVAFAIYAVVYIPVIFSSLSFHLLQNYLSRYIFIGGILIAAASLFIYALTLFIETFFFSAHTLLFLHLEKGILKGLEQEKEEKLNEIQAALSAPASLPEGIDDDESTLSGTDKFYKSLFKDDVNEKSGEMPTIMVDFDTDDPDQIKQIIQDRFKEAEENQKLEEVFEATIPPSEVRDFDLTIEHTEFLPEQKAKSADKKGYKDPLEETKRTVDPLPPPKPSGPKLKVVSMPPLPPDLLDKDKNKGEE
ncbi:hypothetical protein Emin_0621 [Elusimicrobium minutum Pei191]|uniref:Uncharacterized protein n=1 Tax=Elusimicrobium minutum (strain Pei191) TaxID=445932 RepID=B2KC49_ELUMP|nr:hypothetical protein [Elusimicrobium minutum]ACC98176.1 hypothetical protein Emin_0621 [Elusimicrobium minutum Pei191]